MIMTEEDCALCGDTFNTEDLVEHQAFVWTPKEYTCKDCWENYDPFDGEPEWQRMLG